MPSSKEVTALCCTKDKMEVVALEGVTVQDFGPGQKMMYNNKPIEAYIALTKDEHFFLATFMQWNEHTKDYYTLFTAPTHHPVADEALRDATAWAMFENLLVLI